MNNEFKSKIYKLGDTFFNNKFNVPIYQRLYVWGEEQINTLLEDLIKAYQHNEKYDEEHIYYLGGIVVVENNKKFDLIDGQQRFTTLKILRELLGDSDLTLDFSIRDNVWKDFKTLDKSENSDIQRMIDAKRLLIIGLEQSNIDNTKFLTYLKEQVSLVVTIVPKDTDLNKLFELINGRGEQLQQHEILKATILSFIEDKTKEYGKIWDICANIDDYLEISVKKTVLKEEENKLKNITWGDYFESYQNLGIDYLIEELSNIENSEKTKDNSSNLLSEIINNNYDNHTIELTDDPEDEASTQYLPIISFPLFLLYALVSFQKENFESKKVKVEFKDKNLITIFELLLIDSIDEDKAKKFIEYLFNFRKLFDKWIIRNHKEIEDKSNDTNHKISRIVKGNNNKTTTREIKKLNNSRDLSLLQSMLYHSHTRNTQEWIIPYLSNIEENSSIETNLKLLKNIDNVLYSQFETDNTVLQRASSFSKENYTIDCSSIIRHINPIRTIKNYHYFSHYWFYKMDWIIWCAMRDYEKRTKEFELFKFTARNSIEHISPQTKNIENRSENIVSSKYEHSFGNLTLISVSQNSSFSYKSYLEKKAEFDVKKIQNLKMSLLYESKTWGDKESKKHLYDCLQKIKKYYQQDTET